MEDHKSGIEARLAVLESKHDTLGEVVEEIRQDVKKLTSWQKYVLGAGAAVGIVVASGYRTLVDWLK